MRLILKPKPTSVAVVAASILILSLFLMNHARSPEAKRDAILQALVRRDAATLVRLADPDEIAKLHLTTDAVSGVLKETIWRDKVSNPTGIKRVTRVPSDQSLWEAHFAGTHSGITRLIIPVIDDPKVGWKLNLSMMLRSSCYWIAGREDGPGLYRRLARENGILGLRQQDGDYVTLEVLESRAAQLVNQMP